MPYLDDKTVLNDERLLRRIPAGWKVPDYTNNRWRISSAAFDDSQDRSPTSVSLETQLVELGLPVTHPLVGHDGYSLAAVTAAAARQLGLGIQRDPLPTDPAHALLFGKKTDSVRKNLAKQSSWVVAPTEPLPPEFK